ncbi:hypothetical protein DAT35_07855 [Vitiosangium sp. GDMCC 1.1324]|nr:hypothetical protein DAT35_07855 [Vitiosangium sp. GDMCC 1.1324]
MIAISPYGDVKLFGSGQERDEKIGTAQSDPSKRGHLRQVRTIGRRTFAVGMGRQVYRRDGENLWTCLDPQLQPVAGEVKGFESIDGFSESNLYAVGWDGEIWHFDGSVWTQQQSPVDVVLTRVLCAGDGHVYATGRQGLLLRGRDARWEVVEHDGPREDIQDMAWYGDRLYLSTHRQLFTLSGDRLTPIHFGDDAPETCYHLSVADGVLWSFGAKDLMAFNGQKWTRVD